MLHIPFQIDQLSLNTVLQAALTCQVGIEYLRSFFSKYIPMVPIFKCQKSWLNKNPNIPCCISNSLLLLITEIKWHR